jgi:predicted N-acetyltransferase YhbS
MTFQDFPKIVDLAIGSANIPAHNPGFDIGEETLADSRARETLLDAAMGPKRRLKTSERLREGNMPAPGLALSARGAGGALIGTLRLWPIFAGGDRPALLLGPLAVAEQARFMGVGGGLMREALKRAAAYGHNAVLLVGDASYYARFGFTQSFTRRLTLPGPVDRARFLGCELTPGALAGAHGLVRPSIVPNLSCPTTRLAA